MRAERPILALAVAQTVVWAGSFYAFPALLLFWERDLGWTKTDLTAAFTTTLLVSALCAPLAGRLIDRGLGPLVLTGSIALTGVLMAMISQVVSYGLFFALWAVMGVALAGALYEPCFALVTRAKGAGARRSITLITLIAGFAGTLSFPLGDIMSEVYGWRSAALAFAGLTLLVATPLCYYATYRLEANRVPDPAPDPGLSGGISPVFLRRPAFWALGLAFAAIAFNHSAIINHIRPLLDERGVAAGAAVLTASLIGPMQVAGRILIMALEERLPNAAVAMICFLGLVLSPVMLMMAGGVPALLAVFAFLQGGAWGITSIIKPAITRDTLGQRNFGAINGALALPFWMTMALAPFAGSWLWAWGGYGLMLWCASAAALVGLVSMLLALRLHGGAQS